MTLHHSPQPLTPQCGWGLHHRFPVLSWPCTDARQRTWDDIWCFGLKIQIKKFLNNCLKLINTMTLCLYFCYWMQDNHVTLCLTFTFLFLETYQWHKGHSSDHQRSLSPQSWWYHAGSPNHVTQHRSLCSNPNDCNSLKNMLTGNTKVIYLMF